jgi:hypothetical protein
LIHTDFLGNKRFNDDPTKFSVFPLLPDPRHTGLNEAFLNWSPTINWRTKLGRQSVQLGNERHVSDDRFRNLPLLFDGVNVVGTPWTQAQFTVGHFEQLRTRAGTTEPMRLTIIALAMNPSIGMSAAGYAIRHRPQVQWFDEPRYGVKDRSNWVVGLALEGTKPLSDFDLLYSLEGANQQATASGSAAVRASYLRAGLGAAQHGVALRFDHERCGSNGGRYGLQMPLTNQYAFNGNALQFFDTPRDGVRDAWLSLKWDRGPWSVLNELHWFRSDFASKPVGRELDANITYNIKTNAYVRAQWAHFRRANAARRIDVDKLWFTVGYDIR